MNIAIVAPSPYRFVMGGAEHLWLGLQRWINENTLHSCELLKIPTREDNLLELISSYRQHTRTDLGGYDRILSTKYPAWMAGHQDHAVYLQHTLRGLYDTYHFTREPLAPEWSHELEWVRREIDLLTTVRSDDNEAVIRLLDLVEAAVRAERIPAEFARFPGPFARHLIHALDRFAMQPARISAYGAISETVARRTGYFPVGVCPRVIHHPPRLEGFRCGGDDYLFTISRLDQAKRIGLLVEAIKHTRANIPLLIGGTGPDDARLRELAGGDPRIKFLGQMTDEQVLDAYANALAVPFVPFDEDYGLITIEAMRSGKPVLTTTDAGGVTEMVRHGQTGLVVAPDPLAIAAAIDELCADRNRTRQMGLAARSSVAAIGWKPVAEFALGITLGGAPLRATRHRADRRRKAVVVLTFGVTPPRGGGQARVFHLYRHLAERMDVSLVCLCNVDEPELRHQVAPGMWEIRVPKTAEHQAYENEVSATVGWVPVTDIVASSAIHHTPRFGELLDQECADADVVISSHPYLTSILRQRQPALPLWFEVHNVELSLKKGMLPSTPAAAALLEHVSQEESMSWQCAELVYACTQRDLDALAELYGPTKARCFEVPNGFDPDTVVYQGPTDRARLKALLGFEDAPIILFMGSWHGPNLEAVQHILGYADALPHAYFVVVGSAGLYFANQQVPNNVRLVGAVDDEEKQVFLGSADLAVNPMTSGSGSNLKMLDYFAAGVPVLSTRFGARGINAEAGVHFLDSDIEDFLPNLVQALMDPLRLTTMAERAVELVVSTYSWQAIARTALKQIDGGTELPSINTNPASSRAEKGESQ